MHRDCITLLQMYKHHCLLICLQVKNTILQVHLTSLNYDICMILSQAHPVLKYYELILSGTCPCTCIHNLHVPATVFNHDLTVEQYRKLL